METVMRTFHLPLPPALYEELRAEADSADRPATEIVREALERWLTQRRRERLAEEIRAYATAEAGGDADLDPALERASLELLVAPEGAA